MLADRLPSALLTEWGAFEHVHGPVLIHERIEFMLARLCAAVTGQEPEAFFPVWDEVARDERHREHMLGRLTMHLDTKGGR